MDDSDHISRKATAHTEDTEFSMKPYLADKIQLI